MKETEVRRRLPAMQPQLLRYARKLTRGNGALAEDLAQDTSVSALEYEYSFSEGTSLFAWLATILHNHYASAVKRAVREADALAKYPNMAAPMHAIPADTNAVIADIEQSMARIRHEHRSVLMTMYIDGHTQKETSTLLDLPLGTVRRYTHQGRKDLAELLA